MTTFLKERYLFQNFKEHIFCADLCLEIRRFEIQIVHCFVASFRLSSEDDAVLSRSGAAQCRPYMLDIQEMGELEERSGFHSLKALLNF